MIAFDVGVQRQKFCYGETWSRVYTRRTVVQPEDVTFLTRAQLSYQNLNGLKMLKSPQTPSASSQTPFATNLGSPDCKW